MSLYPPSIPRCQHLKINGTQCGSPALRRCQFCFFHERWRETRIAINSNHARRAKFAINLPLLEDADSIQVSLMQIVRLVLAGQIEQKTAGLVLYALQTASSNLSRTRFEPAHKEQVVIDPRTVDQTQLGEDVWSVEEYEEGEDATGPADIEASTQLEIDVVAADARALAESWDRTIAEIEGTTEDLLKVNVPRETKVTVGPRAAKRRKSAAHGASRECKAKNDQAPREQKKSADPAQEGDETGNQILAKVQAVADNRRTRRRTAIVPGSRRSLTLVAHVRPERRRSDPERRGRPSRAIN